jgi:hypothetical protein
MSSWTLLEAAAGQRYNAAEEFLAFAPNTTPENFRCFFITAAGWGTFDQRISQSAQVETLTARYGRLTLRTLEFACAGKATKASALLNGKTLPLTSSFIAKAARLEASPAIVLNAGDSLQVVIS